MHWKRKYSPSDLLNVIPLTQNRHLFLQTHTKTHTYIHNYTQPLLKKSIARSKKIFESLVNYILKENRDDGITTYRNVGMLKVQQRLVSLKDKIFVCFFLQNELTLTHSQESYHEWIFWRDKMFSKLIIFQDLKNWLYL